MSGTSLESPPLKVLTLAFVHRDDQILLGFKKRGFGAGRWNGFGGKVRVGEETIVEGAAREVHEECGLKLEVTDLEKIGNILFEFEGDPVLLDVHVFQTFVFQGEPYETEEMRPQWFKKSDIPFDKMWIDDEQWFPFMLEGKKFKAFFKFRGHEEILEMKLEIVESL